MCYMIEIFPEGGGDWEKSPTIEQIDTYSARRTKHRRVFGAPKAQTKMFALLRHFRLKYRVSVLTDYLLRVPKAPGKI